MLSLMTSGNDLATEKSALLRRLARLPPVRRIHIIDDSVQDAQHVAAALHLLLGRDVVITHFRGIAVALDQLRREKPDILFLDDYLPPTDKVETSLRSLLRFGFQAPVVVISGALTRGRRNELAKLNLLGVLDKDEINTFAIAEVLARLVPDGA